MGFVVRRDDFPDMVLARGEIEAFDVSHTVIAMIEAIAAGEKVAIDGAA